MTRQGVGKFIDRVREQFRRLRRRPAGETGKDRPSEPKEGGRDAKPKATRKPAKP